MQTSTCLEENKGQSKPRVVPKHMGPVSYAVRTGSAALALKAIDSSLKLPQKVEVQVLPRAVKSSFQIKLRITGAGVVAQR